MLRRLNVFLSHRPGSFVIAGRHRDDGWDFGTRKPTGKRDKTMKMEAIGYWTTTVIIAFVLLSGERRP